jgi:phage/plasmid primase-like uncharacterized protein
MLLPGGRDYSLLHAVQKHAGAAVPIALVELPATSAAVITLGIGGKLVITAIKKPNPSDE